jgi:chromosome segregation ATPase
MTEIKEIEFDPQSSEINVKINRDIKPEDKLMYSVYSMLYYSWTNYELLPNNKSFIIINLIPNTQYVISFNNVLYYVNTIKESDEIIKLKVQLNHLNNKQCISHKFETEYNQLKNTETDLRKRYNELIIEKTKTDKYILNLNAQINSSMITNNTLLSEISKLESNISLLNQEHKNEIARLKETILKETTAPLIPIHKCFDYDSVCSFKTESEYDIESMDSFSSKAPKMNQMTESPLELEKKTKEIADLNQQLADLNDKMAQDRIYYINKIDYLENLIEDDETEYNKLMVKIQKTVAEISQLKKDKEQLNKKINVLIMGKQK